MRKKTKLKTGEFSQMMQVTVKTLRHYEQKGLLYPYEVDEWTGYRYYSVEQMQRLNTIRQLQSLGCSLDEIKELYEEGAHAPSVEQLNELVPRCNVSAASVLLQAIASPLNTTKSIAPPTLISSIVAVVVWLVHFK